MERQVIVGLAMLVILLLWERMAKSGKGHQFGGRGEKPQGAKPMPTPRPKQEAQP